MLMLPVSSSTTIITTTITTKNLLLPLRLLVLLLLLLPSNTCLGIMSSDSLQLPSSSSSFFRRGLVPTPLGLVHYTSVGGDGSDGSDKIDIDNDKNKKSLLPIVGFHMSPRSVDEYKEIMIEFASKKKSGGGSNSNANIMNANIMNRHHLFVAMDEFGYGQSDNPNRSCTLDDIADSFLVVLDTLQIEKCIVCGSLMGCYIALSLASRYPERIVGVICNNLYYFTKDAREKALREEEEKQQQNEKEESTTASTIVDSWILQEDGSHINDIFSKRSSWLSTELNTRATLDNLLYLMKRRERYQNGIYIQDGGAFPLSRTCQNVKCPVLCINGQDAFTFLDTIGMEMTNQFDEICTYFPTSPTIVTLENNDNNNKKDNGEDSSSGGGGEGGTSINMLNERASEWYTIVTNFITKEIEG